MIMTILMGHILGTMSEAGSDVGQTPDAPSALSSLSVVSMPWVFTQHQPLSTSQFIDEAKRRGVDLDTSALRQLYRRGVLVPFLYVGNRAVGPAAPATGPDPKHPGGTLLTEFRYARSKGRLSDLALTEFRPSLRFDRQVGDRHGWWNGLLYSWYQLLILPEIKGYLSQGKQVYRHEHFYSRLPEPGPILRDRVKKFRTMAIALATLEARYLPNLDPEWLSLSNAEPEEWEEYRESFDPVAVSQLLGYSAHQARQDAEWLLLIAHRIDPVGDGWSHLIRRAPRKAWKGLKDAALCAMDCREAAEILLRFYTELASRTRGEPLPDIPTNGWHPLHERLSHRPQTLDEDLMDLGLSPHPRVILAVEGEAEQIHAPQVWEMLGYPHAPELMRLLWLEGVDKDLAKVAALAVAPLVGEKFDIPGRESWDLIKPPACLLVAVDPEGKYFAPKKVGRTRALFLREIKLVLKAQGVTNANPAELDELLEIRTWRESCYEFEHFENDELADGIGQVHTTLNGLTRDELIGALAATRGRRKDIKEVWSLWDHSVSKVELAHALWPTLAHKIQACMVSDVAPVPEIVKVVQAAYHKAQRWRYPSFVLAAEPSDISESAGQDQSHSAIEQPSSGI